MLAAHPGARAASLEPLFGTYVGVAEVEDVAKATSASATWTS